MSMIQKILIANRGEIALRIARTCKKMGITTLAIHSDTDSEMPFVKFCDEAISLEGNQLAATYLNIDKIIFIAQQNDCDAIHPGYGFLSENAAFAKACKKAKIKFIGPQANVITEMGDKKNARLIAQKAKVPTVPGYDGKEQDPKKLKAEAKKIGYPVLLKAAAGGGGKGMRIVREEKQFEKELNAAKSEAKNAFGDDQILLEKYFDKVRHIEVQILGDEHKNLIHLNERECSVQRRYQKIIEESPSPAIDEKLRKEICGAAVSLAKTLNYENAGTVEFILDEKGNFYFLEVNTRLQVEHPVTELTTGIDLVEWQIKIAEGQELSIQQEEVAPKGHALECRIYAENPYKNFAPDTGEVIAFDFPDVDGLRLDYGVEQGNKIDVFYDPMIAKVITYGNDRNESIRKMHYALSNAQIIGPENNNFFLQKILADADFISGDIYTHYLNDKPELFENSADELLKNLAISSATAYLSKERRNKQTKFKSVKSGYRNVKFSLQQESFLLNEEQVEVQYETQGKDLLSKIDGNNFLLRNINFENNTCTFNYEDKRFTFKVHSDAGNLYLSNPKMQTLKLGKVSRFPLAEKERTPGSYLCPMPGEITKVLVKKGDSVKIGEPLLVLVSMKMENTIEAQEDGKVEEVFVKTGDFTEADMPLLKLEIKE